MSVTNELRLFVSSTFQDLQEEREHLVKKIFPEIRALCRERGVVFTEIDLRWGLTEEEGMLGKVISTCLEEINRCRPYFIGLFGDRYGWIPPFSELYKDPTLLERYPWLEEGVIEGMSLLEMEVRHGVLNGRERADSEQPGTYFYRRRHRGDSRSEGVRSDERIVKLAEEVGAAGYEVREFRTPEGLGELVYDDLVALIEHNFERVGLTPLEKEQQDHKAFAASRRQAYIPNVQALRLLDRFGAGEEESGRVLVVRAPSGYGKSALVSYWAERTRQNRPDLFLVEHYIGIGSGSGLRSDLIRHLLMEVAERASIEEEVPENPEGLMSLLPEWLSMLGEEPVLFLIDGVNQLPEKERDLSWLPGHLPENIRLIITSTEPIVNELGEKIEWPEHHVEPLTVAEREAVIVRFLGDYHKSLRTVRIHEIASAPQTSNPLFLRVLLEEMRLGGLHEELDELIAHYLDAEDLPALFERVLGRLEEDFGARRVGEIMALLWCSREGLSDTELVELTRASRLHLNLLLTALDYHLVVRSGLYTFFHDYLSRAVEERYLANSEVRAETHARIAEYFGTTPLNQRRLREEPWGWGAAGMSDRLLASLAEPEAFLALSREEWRYELAGYWKEFDSEELLAAYRGMLADFSGSAADRIELLLSLSDTLLLIGETEGAASFIMEAEELATDGMTATEQVRFLLALGTCRIALGEYQEAETSLRRALGISLADPEISSERGIDCLVSLATALYERRELNEASRLFSDALVMSEEVADPKRTFECASGVGAVHYRNRDFDRALEYFEKSREIVEEEGWWDTLRGGECVNNLGAVYRERGEYEKAEVCIAHAVAVYQRVLGELNGAAITMIMNHGNVLQLLGKQREAEERLRSALVLERRRSGPTHPETAHKMVQLAGFLKQSRRVDESRSLLEDATRYLSEALGERHPRTLQSQLELADALFLQGAKASAKKIYERVLPIKEEVLGADNPSVVRSRQKYLKIVE